jgi:ketosteroid isomerase-like protein
METLELARRFIQAVESGELEAVRACYGEDARIWHNFDDVEQTVDENMKVLEWMKRKTTRRSYEITRLEEIAGGYLQQHILRMVNREGSEITMHACLVVRVENGKILRLEEYLDPSPTQKL